MNRLQSIIGGLYRTDDNPSPGTLSNVVWSSSGQAASLVIGFLSSVLLARWLGPESRGIYALVTTTGVLLATILGNNALLSALTYVTGKRLYPLHQVIGNSLLLMFPCVLIAVAFIVLLSPAAMGTLIEGLGTRELGLAIALGASLMVTGILNGILVGLDQIRLMILVSLGRICADLVLQLVFVVVLGLGLRGALLQVGLSSLATIIVVLLILFCRSRPDFRPRMGLLREIVTYSVKFYPGQVGSILLARADLYFVALFAGPASAGVYAVAKGIATLVGQIEPPITIAVSPKIVSADPTVAASVASRSLRTVFWISSGLALAGGLLSPWLFPFLYGQEFADAATIFVLLVPGVVFLATRAVGPFFALHMGRPEIPSLCALLAGVFSLPLFYGFTQHLGAPGAATASSLTSILRGIILIGLFVRSSKQSLRSLFAFSKDDLLGLRAALPLTRPNRSDHA